MENEECKGLKRLRSYEPVVPCVEWSSEDEDVSLSAAFFAVPCRPTLELLPWVPAAFWPSTPCPDTAPPVLLCLAATNASSPSKAALPADRVCRSTPYACFANTRAGAVDRQALRLPGCAACSPEHRLQFLKKTFNVGCGKERGEIGHSDGGSIGCGLLAHAARAFPSIVARCKAEEGEKGRGPRGGGSRRLSRAGWHKV